MGITSYVRVLWETSSSLQTVVSALKDQFRKIGRVKLSILYGFHQQELTWQVRGVCSNEGLTLETSAIYQTSRTRAKKIPYQPLFIKTLILLTRQRRKTRFISKVVFQCDETLEKFKNL